MISNLPGIDTSTDISMLCACCHYNITGTQVSGPSWSGLLQMLRHGECALSDVGMGEGGRGDGAFDEGGGVKGEGGRCVGVCVCVWGGGHHSHGGER